MAESLENLREVRIKKLQSLRDLGVNPYPSFFQRETIAQVRSQNIGIKAKTAGRLMAVRGHGKIVFADLSDESGKIQIALKDDGLSLTAKKTLPFIDIGDFLGVEGELFTTKAGELTINVSDFQILTKSLRPLPGKWHGLTDIETRLRKRYLDLITNPQVREMFYKKAKFWSSVREYLLKAGFLEVETPVLESVFGGADANPFTTHHNALDTDFYLRISLELPLKRLIVGGFEKVFEIGRVFRNEGIDAEHLQDYTQMEFYWAYVDYHQLMDFLTPMYQYIVKETTGGLEINYHGNQINWDGNWPRKQYVELIKEHADIDILKSDIDILYKKAQELGLNPEKNQGKGRLIDLIYKKTVRPKLIQPMFLVDLPVEVSPLAKRKPDNPELTERFQIVAGGSELANGFSELNDPLDQYNRFLEQQQLRDAGDTEAQMMDEDFVEALEYSMPPCAGLGMSERFFAFLMDKPIRETVFFPPMRRIN